ncbi:MAG: hypothetical protein LBD17_04325 [Endomicrobium sp.]|nr:hypothetical protein [Endomicrobium sp.]
MGITRNKDTPMANKNVFLNPGKKFLNSTLCPLSAGNNAFVKNNNIIACNKNITYLNKMKKTKIFFDILGTVEKSAPEKSWKIIIVKKADKPWIKKKNTTDNADKRTTLKLF